MKLSDRLGRDPEKAKKKSAAKQPPKSPAKPPPKIAESTLEEPLTSSARLREGTVGRDELEKLKKELRAGVIGELGPRLSKGTVDETTLRNKISTELEKLLRAAPVSIGPRERIAFIDSVLSDMLGWGPLEPLMSDADVTEIMCNAFDEVWIEREGKLQLTDVKFPSPESYRQVIDRMLAAVGRRVDEASPMADGRLADGSRINAVVPPLATRAPILTIRRFRQVPFTISDLVSMESVTPDAAVFLEAGVRGRLNTVISGGSGSGKTTLLNVLSSFIPEGERVITIEDAAELRLNQPHVVTLEARPANIEGAGEVVIRDLVRNALRMRPDRIIVGEARGGEALDMLQAMNTGHEGSLTTVHANSPRDGLSRIETMTLMAGTEIPLRAVREQIASALDLVVQVDRLPDGRRVVSAITEVQGREGETITMQEIFTRRDGRLSSTGLRPKVTEKMADEGVTVPSKIFRGRSAQSVGRKKR